MNKKIYITEAQFKNLIRTSLLKENEEEDNDFKNRKQEWIGIIQKIVNGEIKCDEVECIEPMTLHGSSWIEGALYLWFGDFYLDVNYEATFRATYWEDDGDYYNPPSAEFEVYIENIKFKLNIISDNDYDCDEKDDKEFLNYVNKLINSTPVFKKIIEEYIDENVYNEVGDEIIDDIKSGGDVDYDDDTY